MDTPGTGEKLVQQLRAFETLYFILNRQPVSHPLALALLLIFNKHQASPFPLLE
jgi:hypothetical protein